MQAITVHVEDEVTQEAVEAALQQAGLLPTETRQPLASIHKSGDDACDNAVVPLYTFQELFEQAFDWSISKTMAQLPLLLKYGSVGLMDDIEVRWVLIINESEQQKTQLRDDYLAYLQSKSREGLFIKGFVADDPGRVWAEVDGETVILHADDNHYVDDEWMKVGETIIPATGEVVEVEADVQKDLFVVSRRPL